VYFSYNLVPDAFCLPAYVNSDTTDSFCN